MYILLISSFLSKILGRKKSISNISSSLNINPQCLHLPFYTIFSVLLLGTFISYLNQFHLLFFIFIILLNNLEKVDNLDNLNELNNLEKIGLKLEIKNYKNITKIINKKFNDKIIFEEIKLEKNKKNK